MPPTRQREEQRTSNHDNNATIIFPENTQKNFRRKE
jgi:hypothetical protein